MVETNKTNLRKKILNSENLFKNENDKEHFEKIKKDLAYLLAYTSAFVEYKFLRDIKVNLIPANKVTENDITPLNKWILLSLYKENGQNLKKSEYFNEENRRRGSHNSDDESMILDSLLSLDNLLEGKWNPRFSTILPESRIHEIEKSIIRYFLYKKGNLKLINEKTFLEDYFNKNDFTKPLNEYFTAVQKNAFKDNQLFQIWFTYFAIPRMYLFSEFHNTKKVTGYNARPIFTGKSEYDYNELKNRIEKLNSRLLEELSDIFRSDWLKSKILDRLPKSKKVEIQIDEMDKILEAGLDDKKQREAIILELLCLDKKLETDISLELRGEINKPPLK